MAGCTVLIHTMEKVISTEILISTILHKKLRKLQRFLFGIVYVYRYKVEVTSSQKIFKHLFQNL